MPFDVGKTVAAASELKADSISSIIHFVRSRGSNGHVRAGLATRHFDPNRAFIGLYNLIRSVSALSSVVVPQTDTYLADRYRFARKGPSRSVSSP